ncbi:Aminotransferase-like plant mobile domain [Arabidopsis suecica]|uniref:Aminotransferase-like plant mobile domain n=1 Tax=Arabidopsis suecica TaxID=45249 RepID=A0A8T2CPB6_ARASU|nr:Aminotransferase-like plant mobile domain [Arabidopsis suecica]
MEKASSSSPFEKLLIEEREEVMVTEKGRTLSKTHFLKPFVTSIDDSVAKLPRLFASSLELERLSSRISFSGFWVAECLFLSWLRKMEPLHALTWKKAGIFEAIKVSTYSITKNQPLILSVAEKWCHETKSFVFPWGEATVTLEDVIVLLGFSVLGSPVFSSSESSEIRDSVKILQKARLENRCKDGRVTELQWILSFRNRNDSLEHEAFLALWLSHFVFPNKHHRSITKTNLPIAVRLARGERIALATPVLANIYKDLSEISRGKSTTKYLSLQSLFKLVQLWIWERFEKLRPEAKEIPIGEPRISRWDGLQQKTENVRLSFDDFEWRPYTKALKNWNPLRLYVEEAMWVTVDDKLEDELVSFARCVRSSKLVGIGFVEDYYPNRVAMQFGLAQDLPGFGTNHRNFTEKEAWDDYNKSLDGLKLYIPSRLAATSVTARYQDWWLKSVSEFLDSSKSTETFNLSNTVDDDDNVSPKVLPLSQVLQRLGREFPENLKRCRSLRIGRNLKCEMEKDKNGDGDGSTSTEPPHLFQKELVNKTSEHLRIKRRKRVQRIKSREKIEGSSSEPLGKRSRLEEDNNDSSICQNLVSGDDEPVAPQEIEQRSEENDQEEAGSKARTVLCPVDENNSSDSPLGANGIIVSPRETRQTCDDELDVYESNEDIINDGSKEPDCLLHEDGIIAREKASSDENLCSSEAEKEDESNIRITVAVEEGNQEHDCSLHDNALGTDETMNSKEQLEDLEKRNKDFGELDAGNDSYTKKFQELKVQALLLKERIIEAQKNLTWLKESRAIKQRNLAAAARWI